MTERTPFRSGDMRQTGVAVLLGLWNVLATLVIAKVLVDVLGNYPDYWPPDFDADFLLGRERYFWGAYHWAFYLHIAVGPGALLLGTLLVSTRLRQRFPKWHRVLGRIQVATGLLVLVPSGLWMAQYASAGSVAGVGFASLAVATAISVALGWRAAVQRRFEVHRQWMWRCYLLLCSTVILRINGGLGEVLGISAEWFYIQNAWTSWVVPLLIFEWFERAGQRANNASHGRR